MDAEPANFLSEMIIYFTGFVFFEVFVSVFYVINNGTIRRRFGNSRFISTGTFVMGFITIAFSYFVFYYFFQDTLVAYLTSLDDTLISLAFLSISMAAFWLVKVILDRRWDFHDTRILLTMVLVSLTITIWMIYNGNSLSFELFPN